MLVFSRKKTEQLVIDEDIVITVVEIRGDQIRLGIEAPKNRPILRREIQEPCRTAVRDQAAQDKAND